MQDNEKINKIKFTIEERYKRISNSDRRPSMEYMQTSVIKELFAPYARDKTKFLNLSDAEIQHFYTNWYNVYRPKNLNGRIEVKEQNATGLNNETSFAQMSEDGTQSERQRGTQSDTDDIEDLFSTEGITSLLEDLDLPEIVTDFQINKKKP